MANLGLLIKQLFAVSAEFCRLDRLYAIEVYQEDRTEPKIVKIVQQMRENFKEWDSLIQQIADLKTAMEDLEELEEEIRNDLINLLRNVYKRRRYLIEDPYFAKTAKIRINPPDTTLPNTIYGAMVAGFDFDAPLVPVIVNVPQNS